MQIALLTSLSYKKKKYKKRIMSLGKWMRCFNLIKMQMIMKNQVKNFKSYKIIKNQYKKDLISINYKKLSYKSSKLRRWKVTCVELHFASKFNKI